MKVDGEIYFVGEVGNLEYVTVIMCGKTESGTVMMGSGSEYNL